MLWFRKWNPKSLLEGVLDTPGRNGESGEGEGGRPQGGRPDCEALAPSLDVALIYWDADDWVIRFEAIGKAFEAFDCPQFEHHELHLERRGAGIWYASLVDYETGRTVASGRLYLR